MFFKVIRIQLDLLKENLFNLKDSNRNIMDLCDYINFNDNKVTNINRLDEEFKTERLIKKLKFIEKRLDVLSKEVRFL